jgi:hypothetical protein
VVTTAALLAAGALAGAGFAAVPCLILGYCIAERDNRRRLNAAQAAIDRLAGLADPELVDWALWDAEVSS